MKKKIILGLVAMAVVVAGVAGMSAWEAHVINVTAHIENALAVNTKALDFGTVFPQEYLSENFTVGLSGSFLLQDRVDTVNYKIVQKTKCVCVDATKCTSGEYAPVGWDTHVCPAGFEPMMSLCPYLSKISNDDITVSHPSYFQGTYCYPEVERVLSSGLNYSDGGWAGWSCPAGTYAVAGGVHDAPAGFTVYYSGLAKPGAEIGGYTYPVFPHHTYIHPDEGFVLSGSAASGVILFVDCQAVPDASGILTLGENTSHNWTVDLKVPPFAGYVGQDWPAGCPVLMDANPAGTDLGCDLWIEVTNILRGQ